MQDEVDPRSLLPEVDHLENVHKGDDFMDPLSSSTTNRTGMTGTAAEFCYWFIADPDALVADHVAESSMTGSQQQRRLSRRHAPVRKGSLRLADDEEHTGPSKISKAPTILHLEQFQAI